MTSRITSYFAPNGIAPLPQRATEIINDYLYFFREFCDLTDRNFWKEYVASDSLDKAAAIAKRIYQQGRSTYQSQYGLVFPADAEILAYAMQRIKSEKDMEVYEMACASGENGLLLALAGAKSVTFNDLVVQELGHLTRMVKEHDIPSNQVNIDVGNCLDILKRKPSLKNRMGLVLCRNLLHFLRTPEQIKLLASVRQMLTENGQAIFVTNSIYAHGSEVGAHLEYSMTSTYRVVSCELLDGRLPNHLSGTPLCSEWTPCEENLLSISNNVTLDLYMKVSKKLNPNSKWKKNEANWKKVDKQFQKKIAQTFATKKTELQSVPAGIIQVCITHVRLYNPTNLSHLFRSNGFDVISEFSLTARGHLVHDFSERFDKTQKIGVIVSKK